MFSTLSPPGRRPVPLGFTPEQFPEGSHICYLFSDDEERERFMSRYVRAGVDQHEFVTYLADTAPDLLEHVAARLGAMPADGKGGQLKLATAMSTYCPDGRFVPERMLDNLRDTYLAMPPGCAGARLGAEMTWATHHLPGTERLVEYEARINDLLLDHPLTTLCQYDTRRFDGATIFELLTVHPIMVVHGQIMCNPFYERTPPGAAAQRNGN